MKKMMKNVMVGTMTGIMAAAMPFAVFASDIDAEQEQAMEMAAEETSQVIEFNLSDPEELLTLLENMDDEECLEVLADLGTLFVADPDFRSMFTVSCLEAGGVELTDEEKDILDNLLKNVTVDDIVDAVQDFDFNEVLKEFGAELDKCLEEQKAEDSAELEKQLDEIGQMLIDINTDDIMEFLV